MTGRVNWNQRVNVIRWTGPGSSPGLISWKFKDKFTSDPRSFPQITSSESPIQRFDPRWIATSWANRFWCSSLIIAKCPPWRLHSSSPSCHDLLFLDSCEKNYFIKIHLPSILILGNNTGKYEKNKSCSRVFLIIFSYFSNKYYVLKKLFWANLQTSISNMKPIIFMIAFVLGIYKKS